jgi:hypothetical protein
MFDCPWTTEAYDEKRRGPAPPEYGGRGGLDIGDGADAPAGATFSPANYFNNVVSFLE